MGYYCLRCKRIVEIKTEKELSIRCPYCGYRALKKERPATIVKKVKAI